jgi:hypothetical protein
MVRRDKLPRDDLRTRSGAAGFRAGVKGRKAESAARTAQMITHPKGKLGVCAGIQGGHSLPAAQPHQKLERQRLRRRWCLRTADQLVKFFGLRQSQFEEFENFSPRKLKLAGSNRDGIGCDLPNHGPQYVKIEGLGHHAVHPKRAVSCAVLHR